MNFNCYSAHSLYVKGSVEYGEENTELESCLVLAVKISFNIVDKYSLITGPELVRDS